jgi:hypothetical protein
MNKQKIFIAIPSLLAMLCTFFPWINEFGYVYTGKQLDGWVTFVLFGTTAVICLGGNLKEALEKKFRAGIYGTSGLGTFIGLTYLIKASANLEKVSPSWAKVTFHSSWQVLPGLYLMVGSGILAILMCAIQIPSAQSR